MSSCTDSDKSCCKASSKKHHCPQNNKPYLSVSVKTILHQIKQPWQWVPISQEYYFCDDPDCPVVYFSENGKIIETHEVLNGADIKSTDLKRKICYCFDVTHQQAIDDPSIKSFVVEKTKHNLCACDIKNPSGRCCLSQFSKMHKS